MVGIKIRKGEMWSGDRMESNRVNFGPRERVEVKGVDL
jgi:hypothetical protein